jgi:hypothetical protein
MALLMDSLYKAEQEKRPQAPLEVMRKKVG